MGMMDGWRPQRALFAHAAMFFVIEATFLLVNYLGGSTAATWVALVLASVLPVLTGVLMVIVGYVVYYINTGALRVARWYALGMLLYFYLVAVLSNAALHTWFFTFDVTNYTPTNAFGWYTPYFLAIDTFTLTGTGAVTPLRIGPAMIVSLGQSLSWIGSLAVLGQLAAIIVGAAREARRARTREVW